MKYLNFKNYDLFCLLASLGHKKTWEAVFTNDFSPTGKYELYTDPRYKGTYNYCNPTTNPIGHFFADMLPYYLTGDKNERDQ